MGSVGLGSRDCCGLGFLVLLVLGFVVGLVWFLFGGGGGLGGGRERGWGLPRIVD